MALPLDDRNIPPVAPAAAMLDANRLPSEELIFGNSTPMRAVKAIVERVTNTKVNIILSGESGCGKEVLACRLHATSSWRLGPFIKINCSILPGTPAESELFNNGNAMFGSAGSQAGIMEVARNGTLFMDEIGDLPTALQPKVLQLLQVTQMGEDTGNGSISHPQLICTTTRNLQDEIAAGNFRAELYYRLGEVVIEIPPLRDRLEDVPRLVDYFLHTFADRFGRPSPPVGATVIRQLQSYSWPGNIRQLENLIRRYVLLGSTEVFEAEMRRREATGNVNLWMDMQGDGSLKQATRRAVQRIERIAISQALQACNWNRKRAAKNLKISYRALLYKIKESGIVAGDPANGSPLVGFAPAMAVNRANGKTHDFEQ